MAIRLILGTLLALALIGAIVTLPAVTGYQVQCTRLDRATCEQTWIKFQEGLTPEGITRFIPITGVTLDQSIGCPPGYGGWTIHRYGLWDTSVIVDLC